MMKLTIDNSTIGYDKDGMDTVYNNIQANLITETINSLEQNIPTLVGNIGNYWVGASADAFKEKIEADTKTVKIRLKEIEEGLKAELDQMMYNVNNSDATIAEDINAMVGLSYGGANRSSATGTVSNSYPQTQNLISDTIPNDSGNFGSENSSPSPKGGNAADNESTSSQSDNQDNPVTNNPSAGTNNEIQENGDSKSSLNENKDNDKANSPENSSDASNSENNNSNETNENSKNDKADEDNIEYLDDQTKEDKENKDIEESNSSSDNEGDVETSEDNSKTETDSKENDKSLDDDSVENPVIKGDDKENKDSNDSSLDEGIQNPVIQGNDKENANASSDSGNSLGEGVQNPVIQGNDKANTNTTEKTSAASSTAETVSKLGITEAQLDTVKAVIRQEAGNNPEEIANVASAIRNRMDAGNWGGTDPYSVVVAKSQFSAYGSGAYSQYTGGNFYQGDDATKDQVDKIINDILLGNVPPTHNYQSFLSAQSQKGTQLTERGNKYSNPLE